MIDPEQIKNKGKRALGIADEPAKPTLGRIVHYRGKLGLHAVRAAVVSCTVDNLERQGVEMGTVPDLDDDMHVHLHVFTPSSVGYFVEYNVPHGDGPGRWFWPPRV